MANTRINRHNMETKEEEKRKQKNFLNFLKQQPRDASVISKDKR